MGEALLQRELEAAHCWEADDRVPVRPQMTEFRRRLRYHQGRWREANGHPIGTQPIVPRKGTSTRLVGSRLPLPYARESGANFLTPGALEAARARAATPERHQRFDHQRLWADLLWSPTLAFNLFGDLAADRPRADRAVRAWWPDTPGSVSEVRFSHSPGRFDWSYLGSLRSFDAAIVLDLGDGTRGMVAFDVKYHEHAKSAIAKSIGRPRQRDVAANAGIFQLDAVEAVDRTDLLTTCLEHLLLLSMLQHESGQWSWGRYVVIHPAGNSDIADICARYGKLLTDRLTFSSITIEELLNSGAYPRGVAAALRTRYIAN
jgi:PD-(D/E)XK nuclease superfamily